MRPLVLAVKAWAKSVGVADARAGCPSSYTHALSAIAFLQHVAGALPSTAAITATLDGVPVAVQPCWSCRTVQAAMCFQGFWLDLTAAGVRAGVAHALRLVLPPMPAGAFGGVYYENVDTVYAAV